MSTFTGGMLPLFKVIFGSSVSIDVDMVTFLFKALSVESTFVVEALNLFAISGHHVVTLMKWKYSVADQACFVFSAC